MNHSQKMFIDEQTAKHFGVPTDNESFEHQGNIPMKVQTRILQNQIEIMWTLSYLLACVKPDLVGKAGELDHMREDLANAAKSSKKLAESL